jgi:hypothetical protein
MVWPFRRSSRAQELDRRRLYIEGYAFPRALGDRIRERAEVELTDAQVALVLEGLRSWFLACLHADGKTLGMPSHAVDAAWHEFILLTREYQSFCEEAFGYYLHHSPEETLAEPMPAALRETLLWSERHPGAVGIAGVPLLFALDAELGYPGGAAWGPAELADLRAVEPATADPSGSVPGGGEAGYWGDVGGWGGDGGGAGCGGGA